MHTPPPGSNHACPPEQPRTPLGATMHALPLGVTTQVPPPVDRMTDTCKKHNLRKLRLRAVIITICLLRQFYMLLFIVFLYICLEDQ